MFGRIYCTKDAILYFPDKAPELGGVMGVPSAINNLRPNYKLTNIKFVAYKLYPVVQFTNSMDHYTPWLLIKSGRQSANRVVPFATCCWLRN